MLSVDKQMFLTLSGFVVILMKKILLRPRTGFCSMGGKLMGSIHIVVFCASLHERTKEGGSMMNYLLLFSFNSILGGTAQHHLHTSTTRIQNIETCTFLIELQLSMPYPNREIDLSTWEV